MDNLISEIVIRRAQRGEPQQVHIPWPPEFGEYGADPITGDQMDAYVATHLTLPEDLRVYGTVAGRAAIPGRALQPCLIVTISTATNPWIAGKVTSTWADGHGGIR